MLISLPKYIWHDAEMMEGYLARVDGESSLLTNLSKCDLYKKSTLGHAILLMMEHQMNRVERGTVPIARCMHSITVNTRGPVVTISMWCC